MLKFAANLSFLYNELPFMERFAAAAKDGFKGVEYLFPYAFSKQEIAAALKDTGLQQVLFNAPPAGHDRDSAQAAWDQGVRGTTCLPGREDEFKRGFMLALEYAETLNCPRIHVMAGLVPETFRIANHLPAHLATSAAHASTPGPMRDTYLSNLRWAAEQAASAGRDVLIEPINTRDIPHFFLNRQDDAHAIVLEVNMPNLKVQFDLYHCQIVEGDVENKIRYYLPTGRVAHLQIAGVPQRHEPDTGELNYGVLFKAIEQVSSDCGWDGWLGCEYRPALGAVKDGTSAGLGWMHSGD
jgi:hydroxypyruvate isomerase